MDIPGKLRADLKRIYGANDPLNYIEDIMVSAVDPRGAEQMLTVYLRVPARMDKYVASTSFGCVPPDMLDAMLYGTHCLGQWDVPGVPKAPEKKSEKKDPMELVDFLKPTKIIYSGPKTIVFWPDGTKTMVSRGEGQEHDDYTAYCAAVVKKMFGATHKAKKFIQSVAVRQESNPRKPKEEPEEMFAVEVQALGSEEVREVPVKPWEQVQTMTMPGTEDPNWGQKHWAPETVEEEVK